MMYSCRLDWTHSRWCCSRRRVVSRPWTGYTPLLNSLLSIYFTNSSPTLGAKVCHQYFLIPISSTWCTPVSSWSNRPLLSGGDSSCSWVFSSCTGPQGESYTQLEGLQSMSPVAIMLIWNWVHSRGYSCEKTQTSSFSCKVYWDTSSGRQSGVTAMQWNAIHKCKQWNVDTQDIVTVNQSAVKAA